MEIDFTIDKLERNTKYDHILRSSGKHLKALDPFEIASELDNVLCYLAINNYRSFVRRVFQVVAHQTYHVEIDENANTTYQAISILLNSGEGNPRINKLEDILNAIGVSVAVCRLDDRESRDVPRACFFQHLIKSERWHLSVVIGLLFKFGLHLRAFEIEESKKSNTLEWSYSYSLLGKTDQQLREVTKDISKVSRLLSYFNTELAVQFVLQAPLEAVD